MLGTERQTVSKKLAGGLYPKLPTRRASDNTWMIKLT
jgi:hypothetical protein